MRDRSTKVRTAAVAGGGAWIGDAEQQEEGGSTEQVHLTQIQKTTELSPGTGSGGGLLGPGGSMSTGKDAQNHTEEGRNERRGEIKSMFLWIHLHLKSSWLLWLHISVLIFLPLA